MLTYREMTAKEAQRILEINATCYIENAWRMNPATGTYELQRIDWTDRELPNGNAWHIRRFRETIAGGGKAFGCFCENGSLIGYATVNADLFGRAEKYVLLDQLFISQPYRKNGIGRELVELCKNQAKEFSAEKLFICAGSSENTIAFYKRLGAVPVAERNEALFAEDPNDIQLEMEIEMRIIEFFTSDDQAHWLRQLEKCEWGAGKFLHQLLQSGKLKETLGETALVPMLIDGNNLVSFCTLAPMDDIQPTTLTPWIGFVYTFPQYRGHRYAGQLLQYAESIATVMGKESVYISTGHTGLYEKYGYDFYQIENDIGGEPSRIYRKTLQEDGAEKDRRLTLGAGYKQELTDKAKQGLDMTAFCGFSCAHCFLGQWCGGCRSVFNCCSFGSLFPKGVCPNVACCREHGLDGCYACPELEGCEKGFYAPDNDGAAACKAQAIFIKRHGKEAFFAVHDRLHEKYDFQKTQEILGSSVEEGLRILEEWFSRE